MKINATTLLFSSIKMCYTKKLVKMKGYHIVYGKEITKSRCCVCSGSALLCIVGKCLSMCEEKIGYEWLAIEGAGSQILFAGYRFFLAGIFTFLIGSFLEKRWLMIRRSSVLPVFGQGMLQTFIQYICFYIGLAHTTGAKGSVINASNAFFALIFAHFMIKSEKMTWKKSIGCLIGFAGVIVINLTPGGMAGGFQWMGEWLILVCSMAYGASSVTLKLLSGKETPTAITAFQLLFGGGMLILAGVLLGGHVRGFTMRSVLLLLYMALLSTVAFSIWALLLKYNPVGKVAVFGFTIPVFGVALSAVFLGEDIWKIQNLAALILVSAGIIFVNREKESKNDTDQRADL